MTTNKQITIDGCDVSGCEYYFEYNKGYCCWYTPCEGNACPYKLKWALQQLKTKEQQCEELKEENKKLKEEILDLQLQFEEEQLMYEI